MNRHSFFGAPRLMVVVGLLMLTLGVAAALAWHAYQAAESHRDAASRVQHDYVTFAGWEFRGLPGSSFAHASNDGST
jgi:hypothetical protein